MIKENKTYDGDGGFIRVIKIIDNYVLYEWIDSFYDINIFKRYCLLEDTQNWIECETIHRIRGKLVKKYYLNLELREEVILSKEEADTHPVDKMKWIKNVEEPVILIYKFNWDSAEWEWVNKTEEIEKYLDRRLQQY